MTAWTPQEKANLRAYAGVSLIFKDFNPLFENAMIAVQAIADGGNLPDTSTQDRMRTVMAQVANIEQNMTNTANFGMALSVDSNDIKVDFARNQFINRKEGRRLIQELCVALSLTGPFVDYWTGRVLRTDFDQQSGGFMLGFLA